MHTEGEICCEWCRYMQYFLILRKNNPLPQFLFISPFCVFPIHLIPFLSSLNDLAIACMLYQRGDDQEASVSGKMRRCVHVTHQCFIHQGVRLMYKVPSLTSISSETSVKC